MRGRRLVVLVTAVILTGPIFQLSLPERTPIVVKALAFALHLGIALVVGYLLWTGTPLFRWIAACLLVLHGGKNVLELLLTLPFWGSYVRGGYGFLCIASAIVLMFSASVSSFLTRRENARLNITSGS